MTTIYEIMNFIYEQFNMNDPKCH